MEKVLSTHPDRIFRFGPFELSERDAELRKNGVRIKLQEQSFQVLTELVANSGRTVAREDLQQKLWPADTFVDFDVGLNSIVRKLRQALGDDADNPRYIETVAKRGYRFLAVVAVAVPNQPMAEPVAALAPSAIPAAAVVSAGASPVADGLAAAEQAAEKQSRWRTRLRPWQLAMAGVALLAVGVGIAWWLRPTAAREVKEQKITANPPDAPVTGAVISPDGKYVAYSDSTGVYIRHIDSGETRPLELPKNSDAVPTGWFPDSTYLVLTMAESGHEFPGLWKASILGGSPTTLLDQASGGVMSPDGSKIAFLRATGETLGVWVARSDGTDPKEIVTGVGPKALVRTGGWSSIALYEGSWAPRLAWSPKGNRIAFVSNSWTAYGDPENSVKMTLRTIDVNGRELKQAMESTQLRPPLAWAPDGRLLFAQAESTANGTSNMGAWSVRVDERTGTAEGNPVALTHGAGRIGGLSVSATGKRFVLWRANTQPQVFITQPDVKGDHFATPRQLTMDESTNWASAWTPDGRAVLFASNRGGNWRFFRQGIDQPSPDALSEGSTQFVLPRLSPDGSHILYQTSVDARGGSASIGLGNLMEIPLQGGMPRLILQMQYLYNHQCTPSPADVCVLNTFHDGTAQFYRFDPAKGTTKGLTSFHLAGEAVNWSMSPGGRMMAFVFSGAEPKITFMELRDQSMHEVELRGWASVNNVNWTASGKSVLAIAQSRSGTSAVLEVEPSGRYEVRLEGDKNVRFYWAIQSPDGRQVLLELLTGENNVWMVENY